MKFNKNSGQKNIGKLYRLWNIVWGIIGGVALVLGLVTAGLTLLDRYSHQKPTKSVKEYIFGSQFYYVQALVNSANKVEAYGVTTRSKDFEPKIKILEGLKYCDANKSATTVENYFVNCKSGEKEIVLGQTTFAELNSNPESIYYWIGAHDFYYDEGHYFGNPGNYQTYYFGYNESGEGAPDYSNLPYKLDKLDISNTGVSNFRKITPINTYYVTGLFVDVVPLRKYLIGPDYDQIRVIPDSALETNKSRETQLINIGKLSAEVDIERFISALGNPLVINTEPVEDIRGDSVIEEKTNYDRGAFVKLICSTLFSPRIIFRGGLFYCIKSLWTSYLN